MRGARFLAAALLAGGCVAGAASRETLEYQVKAALLFNFAKLVEWPAHAFATPDAPVAICVVGADPFGQTLDEYDGERAGDRRLAISRVRSGGPVDGCHVLFVSASEQADYKGVLARADARRVVTVGDRAGFIRAGGLIEFFLEQGRVRFALQTRALHAAEFRVSSKLLRVARPPQEDP